MDAIIFLDPLIPGVTHFFCIAIFPWMLNFHRVYVLMEDLSSIDLESSMD
jgi:hypothetical protein